MKHFTRKVGKTITRKSKKSDKEFDEKNAFPDDEVSARKPQTNFPAGILDMVTGSYQRSEHPNVLNTPTQPSYYQHINAQQINTSQRDCQYIKYNVTSTIANLHQKLNVSSSPQHADTSTRPYFNLLP